MGKIIPINRNNPNNQEEAKMSDKEKGKDKEQVIQTFTKTEKRSEHQESAPSPTMPASNGSGKEVRTKEPSKWSRRTWISLTSVIIIFLLLYKLPIRKLAYYGTGGTIENKEVTERKVGIPEKKSSGPSESEKEILSSLKKINERLDTVEKTAKEHASQLTTVSVPKQLNTTAETAPPSAAPAAPASVEPLKDAAVPAVPSATTTVTGSENIPATTMTTRGPAITEIPGASPAASPTPTKARTGVCKVQIGKKVFVAEYECSAEDTLTGILVKTVTPIQLTFEHGLKGTWTQGTAGGKFTLSKSQSSLLGDWTGTILEENQNLQVIGSQPIIIWM
jgi:hypothetical protein